MRLLMAEKLEKVLSKEFNGNAVAFLSEAINVVMKYDPIKWVCVQLMNIVKEFFVTFYKRIQTEPFWKKFYHIVVI